MTRLQFIFKVKHYFKATVPEMRRMQIEIILLPKIMSGTEVKLDQDPLHPKYVLY